jgi:hypothetical protein
MPNTTLKGVLLHQMMDLHENNPPLNLIPKSRGSGTKYKIMVSFIKRV